MAERYPMGSVRPLETRTRTRSEHLRNLEGICSRAGGPSRDMTMCSRSRSPTSSLGRIALVEAGYSTQGHSVRPARSDQVRCSVTPSITNLIATNPAQGVEATPEENGGHQDATLRRTLKLPKSSISPTRRPLSYRRWLPWLIAFSGARVGEVAQLWGSRILEVDGIPVMRIAPAEDGGTSQERRLRTRCAHTSSDP